MIFTGFTDPAGNVIPVQGAGTVYNEEKNSLALGKDTVAIGQDQFVFGRKNVQDASKAEIAGGGEAVDYLIWGNQQNRKLYLSDFTKVTSAEEFVSFIQSLSSINNILIWTDGNEQKKWSEGKTFGGITNYPNKDLWVSAKFISQNMSLLMYLVITDTNPSLASDENEAYRYNLGLSQSGSSWQDSEFWYLTLDTKTIKLTPHTSAKNIRTLGWDGTQWNAGDITCDDGNGNTISMRDLLSRIATLEAAAANS